MGIVFIMVRCREWQDNNTSFMAEHKEGEIHGGF